MDDRESVAPNQGRIGDTAPPSLIRRLFGSASARLAIGTVALAVAPGVAGVLAARTLGAEGRGELAVAIALATLAGSVGMRGLDTAMLADGAERDDRAKRALLVRRARTTLVLEGLFAGCFVSVALRSVELLLGLTVAVLGAATTLFLLARSLNLGSRRAASVLRSDLSAASTMLAGSILATFTELGPSGYMLAATLGLLVGSRIALGTGSDDSAPDPDQVAAMEHRLRSIGRPAWLARVLQAAAFRLDRVVLAAIAGSGAAGVYAAVVPFAEMATIVPLHLSQLATARIAGSGSVLRWPALRESRVAIALASISIAVVVALAKPIVTTVYGDEFVDGVSALRLLAVASLVSVIWRFSEAELFGRRRPAGAVISTALAAVLVLAGTAAFSSLGADGAALASLVGYAAALLMSLCFVRRARRG